MAIPTMTGGKCAGKPMQHEVFVNPSLRFRAMFPFIAELQADVAEGRDRMVAPMPPFAAYSRSWASDPNRST